MSLKDGWARVKQAWAVFRGKELSENMGYTSVGVSSSMIPYSRPTASQMRTDRSPITAILNRIAIDAAQIKIVECMVDENDRYVETLPSGLNNVLTWDANIDQSGFAFKLDIYSSLCTDGVIALVPYNTEPAMTAEEFDIREMRVATIVSFAPRSVRVNLYNEATGKREEINLPKSKVAIIQNPFYEVMNSRNSLAQRLMAKYKILDMIDQRLGSSRLDLIVQLPYPFKGETRQEMAKKRQDEINKQLTGTEYGIAYIDGSEKVIQLNRPIENNLLAQIEYMEKALYTQLSMTPEILNGTASEETMLNYYNRCIEPLVTVVIDEMTRKFVRGRDADGLPRHTDCMLMMFRDPFKLVPVGKLAEIADKFTRNEIASSNEIRTVIGWKPSADPRADELRNANLNHPEEEQFPSVDEEAQYPEYEYPDDRR